MGEEIEGGTSGLTEITRLPGAAGVSGIEWQFLLLQRFGLQEVKEENCCSLLYLLARKRG